MDGSAFEDFQARARAEGFDEVLVREWAPGQVVPLHEHPFAAKAVVVEGEMWLTVGETTQHIEAGGGFELAPHVSHSERYGSSGTVYWVARRSPPPT